MKFVIVDDDDIIYHSPLGPEKTTALQNLLREARCFSPSFVGADPYLIESYVVQFARDMTKVTFLLDRNIYSQVLGLAKGARVTEKTRFAAGIMAFASCANAQIEPSLALYEGSDSGARAAWKNDLALFHKVDDIDPANWAALALGYAQRFDRKIPSRRLRSEIAQNFDPAMKLKSFGFVYPILLKMANIQSAPAAVVIPR